MTNDEDIICNYKQRLIEEGLVECKHLLSTTQRENTIAFYQGSIEGFKRCKTLDYEQFEKEIWQLRAKEERILDILNGYINLKSKSKDYIREYHKSHGFITQVAFVYDRLKALKIMMSNDSN